MVRCVGPWWVKEGESRDKYYGHMTTRLLRRNPNSGKTRAAIRNCHPQQQQHFETRDSETESKDEEDTKTLTCRARQEEAGEVRQIEKGDNTARRGIVSNREGKRSGWTQGTLAERVDFEIAEVSHHFDDE